MKTKIILIFLISLICYDSELKAQNLKLQAGVNFPSTSNYWQEFGEIDVFVLNLGFLIGPTYEFSFNELNKLKIGAILNLKGYKSKTIGEFGKGNSQLNLLYMDIPLLYHRKFKIGGHSFFAEFGPYTGIGLKGKLKLEYENNDGDLQYDESILFGKNNIDYLKTVDYGLLFGVGADIKSWQVGMSFSLGLRNISKWDFDVIKNRVVAVYASYPLFGGKRIH